MLFSRRKRATAVEPVTPEASVYSNGADPDVTLDEVPTLEAVPLLADPLEPFPTVLTSTAGAPTVPVAAPSATLSAVGPPEDPTGMPLAPGDETGDADLDRFFAALRQVVHDARERLPLESDRLDGTDVVADTSDPRQTGQAADADLTGATSARTMVPTQYDPLSTTDLASGATEFAPSTAELISSLEADRDLWRERAVVWRERAMGADMLVKTLNAHMSDLQINLEDLRLAMRVMSANTPVPPEPRAELPAQTPRRSGIDRFLEPGK